MGATTPETPSRRFGAGRIVLIVIGSIVGLIALGLLAGAGALTWANATQRDADGFFATGYHRYATATYALTRERVRVFTGADRPGWIGDPGRLATARIRLHATGGDPLFVGIARTADIGRYLSDVAHDEVDHVEYHPFSVLYVRSSGGEPAGPPGAQRFWTVSDTGTAPSITWPVRRGDWSLVVMNADGSRVVDADVQLAAKVNFLGWISLGLLGAGVLLAALAVLLIVLGVRGPPTEPAAATVPGPEPVAVNAVLEPGLSRWLWLVKWLLLIPHFVVLVFLWLAFFVLTVIAFFAILFTRRYPRGIFDFNLGVMRWAWRVAYYSYGALGTDRYPPFTLGEVPDYPARLDVEYPGELSRGLVLVKWWLLAIPHYLVLAVLLGGFGVPFAHFGLAGLLVLFAAVALLFGRPYPPGIFDFVMGVNRWAWRVGAYVALMTDRYPPFRLDQGGSDVTDRD